MQRPVEDPTAGPSNASAAADQEDEEDRDFAADMRAKAQAKRKALAPEAAQVTFPAALESIKTLSVTFRVMSGLAATLPIRTLSKTSLERIVSSNECLAN